MVIEKAARGRRCDKDEEEDARIMFPNRMTSSFVDAYPAPDKWNNNVVSVLRDSRSYTRDGAVCYIVIASGCRGCLSCASLTLLYSTLMCVYNVCN